MLRFSLHLFHIFLENNHKINVQLIVLSPYNNIAIMVGCKLLSYTPRNKPKQQDKWNYFVDQFHELLKGVQELIFVKLHGGIKVWTLEKGIVIVYVEGLTKCTKWLPIVICLLTFTKIINIFIIPNHYVLQDEY